MKLTQLEIDYDSGKFVEGQEMRIKGNQLIYINSNKKEEALSDKQMQIYKRLENSLLDGDSKKDLRIAFKELLKNI